MSGDPQLRDPAFAINEDERRGRGMSGRIEDQVKAEIASRRLHPDDGYSYEECNGPSCRAIRDGGFRAAPPSVEPNDPFPSSNLHDPDYTGHEGHEGHVRRGLCNHPSHAASAAAPPECGAPAVGGPCILPRAHNMGHVDIPSNHRAAAPPVEPDVGAALGRLAAYRAAESEPLHCRDCAGSHVSSTGDYSECPGVPPPDRVAGLRERVEAIAFKRLWHNDPHGDIPCWDVHAFKSDVLALLAEPVPGLDVERLGQVYLIHREKWHVRIARVPEGMCIAECIPDIAAEYARLSETPDAD